MHPTEQQWIKDNASRYAKQQGISVDQAISDLTAQANRQVQNGSPGAWNASASAFLGQAHGMLPADGNSGPGYMFYATPDQKANTNMYASYYPNGVGPNRPSQQQIQNSVNREQANRNLMGGGVIAAATAGTAIPGAPIAAVIGGTAAAVIGGTVSGGMDAAAQYSQSGEVRAAQSAFAATVGAITGPIGGNLGFMGNVLLGGAGAATTTAFNNAYYGDNSSTILAFAVGAGFAGAAYPIGLGITKIAGLVLPSIVFPSNMNPNVPAILQGGRNALPANIGTAAGGIAGGMSSFVPSQDAGKLKK